MRKINKTNEEVVELYKNGMSSCKIAAICNCSSVNIRRILKNNIVTMRGSSENSRKYKINEDFFDKIDTEEKAYILGFLYADGNNQVNKTTVSISLKETDKEILEKITKIIQPLKPLQYRDRTKKLKGDFKNSKNQYRLIINNKKISKKLSELGCGKAKSNTIIFPTFINELLIHHFIRGYFDGDGCVTNSGSNVHISILSTVEFLKSLQIILNKVLGFKINKLYKRHKNRDGNVESLTICGNKQISLFRSWLYKDATIFLKTKHDKFFIKYSSNLSYT